MVTGKITNFHRAWHEKLRAFKDSTVKAGRMKQYFWLNLNAVKNMQAAVKIYTGTVYVVHIKKI